MGNFWSSSSSESCSPDEPVAKPAVAELPLDNTTKGPEIASFHDVLHLDYFNSLLTLGSCLYFMYWGALRLYQFKRNSVQINPRILKAPLTFKIQTFLQGLMTYFNCIDIFAILLFIKQENECQYILSILSSLSLLISWIFVYLLTQIETTCKFSTESPIYEHHGMLRLFWHGRFLIEILNTLWLFWEQRLIRITSISCFYLLIRVAMVEIILVLGLQAPGLTFPSYQYYNFDFGGGDVDYDDNEIVQQEEDEETGEEVGTECGSGLSIVESADECLEVKDHGENKETSIDGFSFGGATDQLGEENDDDPEIKEFVQGIVDDAKFDEHGNLLRIDPNATVNVITNADQLPIILTKFNTWKRLTMKFVWPENDVNIKLLGLTYAAIIGTQLVLNLWEDVNYKYVVDSLNPMGASSISKEDGETSIGFHWGYLAIGLLISIASYGIRTNKEQLMYKMITSNQKKLQVQLFEKAHYQSLRWHLESYNQQQIIGLIYSPFDNFMYSIEEGITGLMNLTEMIIALIYVTLIYNQQITILFILTIIYTTAFESILNTIFQQRQRNYSRYHQRFSSSQNQFNKAIGSIYCYETVKYFSNEDYEINRFKQALDSMENQSNLNSIILDQIVEFSSWFVQEFGVFIAKLFCLWALVNSNENNEIEITAGDFIFLTTILNMYSTQFSRSTAAFETLGWAMASSETLETMLESIPEVRDEPNAPDFNFKCGEIEFKNVGFYYESGKQVLKNVNFKIGCGKTLAIVGPSGSGKSTIMKLLFRFYDTTEGEIIIDGQNIKKVKQKTLRQVIGVVPQDCILLDDTIWYNLQYAKINATEADLNRAAKSALIYDTIISFPKQYETQVGQRGQRLSGGEKQRVAIARVLLKNPPIFLLDEATSSLDTLTERKIHESLKKASKNRTTIIVAHRLSTIVNADQIIVLKQGTVIETGNHQQLMNINGTYAELWKAQTTAAESKVPPQSLAAEPNVT